MQYVDNDVLEQLVPRLSELMKTGIGLGTKVMNMWILSHLPNNVNFFCDMF